VVANPTHLDKMHEMRMLWPWESVQAASKDFGAKIAWIGSLGCSAGVGVACDLRSFNSKFQVYNIRLIQSRIQVKHGETLNEHLKKTSISRMLLFIFPYLVGFLDHW